MVVVTVLFWVSLGLLVWTHAVYPLAATATALDDVLERRATGKVLIDPTI